VLTLLAIIACSLVPPAQVSAVPDPLVAFTAETIDLDEPEHGHYEHDTSMLEHTLLDVHSPIMTGGMVKSQQSFVLLEAANRGIHDWWVTTPLGKPFVLGDVLRACAIARHRKAAVQCST
jgi:hypothetical protein